MERQKYCKTHQHKDVRHTLKFVKLVMPRTVSFRVNNDIQILKPL